MRESIEAQIGALRADGYVLLPKFVPQGALETLRERARAELAARQAPLELEAELQYPGAPRSPTAAGGQTVRRLLDAYGRDPAFRHWATAPAVRAWMGAYFAEDVLLSRAHHNCLMTKHPLYGSMTGWHRDIRYWSFEREDLVSVWIALGPETVENGALWFVPGSHAMALGPERFDEAKFLRIDRADNAEIVRSAVSMRLAPGDAVLFHCNTLHSAGTNTSAEVKFSLVFTYHGRSNAAKPGTRSASKDEVSLSAAAAAQRSSSRDAAADSSRGGDFIG
ncbi:MAG TPA: phytanoyl-CoA dioxygenase family protein [Steroidobacteraceae bacterium]|nr:phytanoyl-CoA dioxygenase family protein [Steroidobacteraceae bacterium]